MEKRSNLRIDDDSTRDAQVDKTQDTCSSTYQKPKTSSQNRTDVDQAKVLPETNSLDEVSDATTGLPVMSGYIPDPYILSQISICHSKLSSGISVTQSGLIQDSSLPTSIQPFENLATFTLFPNFPFELRRIIWKMTFPGPRIILIKSIPRKRDLRNTFRRPREYNTYKSNYTILNTMLVCKEALDVILEDFRLVRVGFICKDVPGPCLQKKIAFNFKVDSIYIRTEDDKERMAVLYSRRWRPISMFRDLWSDLRFWKNISHLILSIPGMYKGTYHCNDFLKYIRDIFARMNRLNRLTFVLEDQTKHLPYTERDLALEYPMDIDCALDLFTKHPREVSKKNLARFEEWYKEFSPGWVGFNMDYLRYRAYRNDWTSARRPLIIPEDAIVEFQIIVRREKSEELVRRKKEFYALKRQIAEEEGISVYEVCYRGPDGDN
ncbi:hypothetical protein BCIN_05g04980 [Botrytis cinerea B05.10]|uniref:2EXR domain-containing protein n=2 Tax=Botryotinia fuckeliana TaxID=40559 RepID=A0A384JI91_BOTFB|nr:hypothetical protein BCIN_05g04980 [Botrytis cinerea B05.10]ATZ50117.1 hypothetical protein BCIN_05g04980 [Botrytis cinerea B05.10]CCD53624.1 hypothetical protein BofuT4_P136690.1 [Botrytis cinerea T4]